MSRSSKIWLFLSCVAWAFFFVQSRSVVDLKFQPSEPLASGWGDKVYRIQGFLEEIQDFKDESSHDGPLNLATQSKHLDVKLLFGMDSELKIGHEASTKNALEELKTEMSKQCGSRTNVMQRMHHNLVDSTAYILNGVGQLQNAVETTDPIPTTLLSSTTQNVDHCLGTEITLPRRKSLECKIMKFIMDNENGQQNSNLLVEFDIDTITYADVAKILRTLKTELIDNLSYSYHDIAPVYERIECLIKEKYRVERANEYLFWKNDWMYVVGNRTAVTRRIHQFIYNAVNTDSGKCLNGILKLFEVIPLLHKLKKEDSGCSGIACEHDCASDKVKYFSYGKCKHLSKKLSKLQSGYFMNNWKKNYDRCEEEAIVFLSDLFQGSRGHTTIRQDADLGKLKKDSLHRELMDHSPNLMALLLKLHHGDSNPTVGERKFEPFEIVDLIQDQECKDDPRSNWKAWFNTDYDSTLSVCESI